MEMAWKTLIGLIAIGIVIVMITSYVSPRISTKAYFISYYAEDTRLILEELQGVPFDTKINYLIEEGIIVEVKDDKVTAYPEEKPEEKLTKAIKKIPGTTIGEVKAKGILTIIKKGNEITFEGGTTREDQEKQTCGQKPINLKKIKLEITSEPGVSTDLEKIIKNLYEIILRDYLIETADQETITTKIIIKKGQEKEIIIEKNPEDTKQTYLACELQKAFPEETKIKDHDGKELIITYHLITSTSISKNTQEIIEEHPKIIREILKE